MSQEKKYFYGPVPSRRLGRSLGVDIVPFKVCTLDCVYCQLGRTTEKTIERQIFTPVELIEAEFMDIIGTGLQIDYITIAGAGEPTLNAQLGEIIQKLKKHTEIPVAVVTNGTLFYKQDVRADCALADVVLPSLDAGDQRVFEKVNRPHPDISIDKHISGLSTFRKEYTCQIWLEVFLIEPLNTSDEQIAKIRAVIERINPDKVQLNTAVRPTADADILKLSEEKLNIIAIKLGLKTEVIADFSRTAEKTEGYMHSTGVSEINSQAAQRIQTLLSMLKRRPCSVNDISSVMKISHNEVIKYVTELLQRGLIETDNREGVVFYKAL